MSSTSQLVVLDTGVVIHALRASPLWDRIESEHNLLKRAERPLLPVVCVGELLALGKLNNWGVQKLAKLEGLLSQLTIVDIHNQVVLNRYAEIKAFLRTNLIPQNDMWVAAIASAAEGRLLTCDKDFDRLDGHFIQRAFYSPAWKPSGS